jgi:hypothetical protein
LNNKDNGREEYFATKSTKTKVVVKRELSENSKRNNNNMVFNKIQKLILKKNNISKNSSTRDLSQKSTERENSKGSLKKDINSHVKHSSSTDKKLIKQLDKAQAMLSDKLKKQNSTEDFKKFISSNNRSERKLNINKPKLPKTSENNESSSSYNQAITPNKGQDKAKHIHAIRPFNKYVTIESIRSNKNPDYFEIQKMNSGLLVKSPTSRNTRSQISIGIEKILNSKKNNQGIRSSLINKMPMKSKTSSSR